MNTLKLLLPVLFLINSLYTNSTAQIPKSVSRPKLVVGIVVDQMRWDYLYKYYERYSDKGFKRLLNEGYSCQNTLINYLPTYTAPGHTCIYTGSVPALHGIAANDWVHNATGRKWYCTEDTAVLPVGGSYKAGRMSPRNMQAGTITDELRLSNNFQSRVFGFAIKDRGSILPAGHLASAAYWYDDSTGNFISSSYYMQNLPRWMQDFNNRKLADSFMNLNWNLLYPRESYKLSLADNNAYEGLNKGEKEPVFPHITRNYPGNKYSLMRSTPWGNTLTLQAAQACIAAEDMGQKGFTDFVCISLSSTDYIGHQYAPNSMEIEDTYLRLDLELAGFLSYLDQKVGKGEYLLFLSADHGAAHNADYLEDIKMPAKNVSLSAIQKELNAHLNTLYKVDKLVSFMWNDQVVFDENLISSSKLNRNDIKKATIGQLYKNEDIAYVIDMEDAHSLAAVPEPVKTMAINGYNRQRSGSLFIIFKPACYTGYAKTGTTHGSWNPYDAHIPLVWYGWKIIPGEHKETVYMHDIAATLATLLHIQMPNANIGKAIPVPLKK